MDMEAALLQISSVNVKVVKRLRVMFWMEQPKKEDKAHR